jgi:hypothetical protein
LSSTEEQAVEAFLASVEIVGLTEKIKLEAIEIRRRQRLKLADAIIVATAATLGVELLTNDLGITSGTGVSVVRCPLA